jgi:uncharacterized Zn finger protein
MDGRTDGRANGNGRRGIASILHRDTLAVIVGNRTFERGQECFSSGRVISVEVTGSELRGTLRPAESGRAPYRSRIWIHDDGVAYECTCPMGQQRQFCKHGIAIALAHLEAERVAAERGLGILRDAMLTAGHEPLVEGLLRGAARDAVLADELKRICLDVLGRG